MANSLEEILETLLSQPKSHDIIKQLSNSDTSASQNSITKTEPNEKTEKLQKKIDLLKAIEPLLGDKNKEYINLFIKALTIAKVISGMESEE